mgnify:CR=1 FL=1
MQVSELMSRDVVTVRRDVTLAEAVERMLERVVGSVIVTEDGLPVGIVTQTDVLGIGYERDVPFSDIPVPAAMTEELVTGDPEMTVRRAVDVMTENDIKKLPIVEDFSVVGIVTISAVVREHVTLISEAKYASNRRREWEEDDD